MLVVKIATLVGRELTIIGSVSYRNRYWVYRYWVYCIESVSYPATVVSADITCITAGLAWAVRTFTPVTRRAGRPPREVACPARGSAIWSRILEEGWKGGARVGGERLQPDTRLPVTPTPRGAVLATSKRWRYTPLPPPAGSDNNCVNCQSY